MKSSSVLLLCVASLILLSSCHAARPKRQLTQVVATANSVAGPGETVISKSGASSDTGKTTVSEVSAQGAGPGTTVKCQQEAKSGQVLSKECGGPGSSSSWDTAPACKKAPSAYKVSYGSVDKKPWGYDDGKSCALRGPDGKALA